MTRDPSIYLAPGEPRCDPTSHCKDAATCARALAQIPPGTPLESRSPTECTHGFLSHYLSVSDARKAMPVRKVARPALPW